MGWITAATVGIIAVGWRYRRMLLIRAMESCLYTWGMRWIVPRVRFTWRHAKLPNWKFRKGGELLEPGDIILTVSRWQLTSMCIPGELTHAALCVGGSDGRERVAEMVCSGYRRVNFWDVCRASRVVILRCTDWDDEYTREVVERCRSFEGTPYDPQFAFGLASLYCSELVYHADCEHRLQVATADLMGLGRPYVAPQDLLEALNVKVVWDSDLETK